MRGLRVLIVLIVIAVAGGAVYFILGDDVAAMLESTSVVTDEKAIDETVVAFVRNPFEDDYGIMRLAGYVENKSKKPLAEVSLEIQLLDGDGNKKELVKYRVENVQPSSRKPFDANAGTIQGDRRAQIKVVSLEMLSQ
jgi:hypothetical protein